MGSPRLDVHPDRRHVDEVTQDQDQKEHRRGEEWACPGNRVREGLGCSPLL